MVKADSELLTKSLRNLKNKKLIVYLNMDQTNVLNIELRDKLKNAEFDIFNIELAEFYDISEKIEKTNPLAIILFQQVPHEAKRIREFFSTSSNINIPVIVVGCNCDCCKLKDWSKDNGVIYFELGYYQDLKDLPESSDLIKELVGFAEEKDR